MLRSSTSLLSVGGKRPVHVNPSASAVCQITAWLSPLRRAVFHLHLTPAALQVELKRNAAERLRGAS